MTYLVGNNLGVVMKRLLQRLVLMALIVWVAAPQAVLARTGESAPTIATWDTRASSLGFSYLEGLYAGGHMRFASYFTTFSSTTGRLSSQFGLHSLGYGEGTSSAHGMGGTITGLYAIPLTARKPNGLPWVAIAPYGGLSPAAMVSGDFAAVAIPAHVGLGLPISPLDWLTVTPWLEAAVGLGLELNVDRKAIDDVANGVTKPENAKASELIRLNSGLYFGSRFGLNAAFHVGKRIDFQVSGMGNWLSQPTSDGFVFMAGAALLWHWDEVVPGVLPDKGCPPPADVSQTGSMI